MDAKKLIGFIGYPSSDSSIDEYLTENGITQRLTSKDLPSAIIYDPDRSVALQFTSSYPDNYGEPKGQGLLFLEDVTFLNFDKKEKLNAFNAEILNGITMKSTPEDVIAAWGKPDDEEELGGATFFYYDTLLQDRSIVARVVDNHLDFVRVLPLPKK